MANALFTSRDVSSAHELLPVIRRIQRDGRLKAVAAATGPGKEVLEQAGCPLAAVPEEVDGQKSHADYPLDPDSAAQLALRHRVIRILARWRPKVVVTGCSSYGYGIDEAAVYEANIAGIPTCSYLDGWGIGNSLGGSRARTLLVADKAAQKAAKGWRRKDIHIIGSPRQAALPHLDARALAARFKADQGLENSHLLFSFFAQAPLFTGYMENVRGLLKSLAEFKTAPFQLAVKAHPKYGRHAREVADMAVRLGLETKRFTAPEDNQSLFAASDLVFVCNSMAGVDHAHFVSRSETALGAAVYLSIGTRLHAYILKYQGFSIHPYVAMGMGFRARRPADLQAVLQDAASQRNAAREYHAATRKLDVQDPVPTFVRHIYALTNHSPA